MIFLSTTSHAQKIEGSIRYLMIGNYARYQCPAGKNIYHEDSLHAPQWKILNDKKEITGHVCTNAFMTDTVKKKQKVEGWFAPDLKNNGGPELFFGLPGLILEVNINNGGMIITADKIDLKKLTVELNLPKKIKGKKNQKKITVPIL